MLFDILRLYTSQLALMLYSPQGSTHYFMLIPPYGYQQQVESILQVEQTRTKVQGLQKSKTRHHNKAIWFL